MRARTIMVTLAALACGLGATYTARCLLAERFAPEEREKVIVLVAKKNLDIGTTIEEPKDMFAEKTVFKDEEPKAALRNYEDLKGLVLRDQLHEGDFATTDMTLPTGYRAVFVRVSELGTEILPLARVDVGLTVKRGDDKKCYSSVLLQDVFVLAVENLQAERSSGVPRLTVALTLEEAEKVLLAEKYGALVLRRRIADENHDGISSQILPEVTPKSPANKGTNP
jgi:Flp pilus assembly protein CpaB